MRSKVADDTRDAQRMRMLAMTPAQRVAEAESLLESALALYMAGQQVSREEAIRRIRRSRQTGRRFSRCLLD